MFYIDSEGSALLSRPEEMTRASEVYECIETSCPGHRNGVEAEAEHEYEHYVPSELQPQLQGDQPHSSSAL